MRKKTFVMKSILLTVLASALALHWFANRATAKLIGNTIDPVAVVSPNGKQINVTGPFSCDQVQPVVMRITVSQRTTGALAEGKAIVIGNTSPQQWSIQAKVVGHQTFEPGPATIVALARSVVPYGTFDDSHQWLVNVNLVEE